MIGGVSVALCLPCRNEGAHLKEVVDEVPPSVDEVIVVSNRSTDDTVDVARSVGVTVAVDDRATGGIGYGYALMTGMSMADTDVVVTADCDGTYPLADIDRAVGHLVDHGLDFVSCNRYPMADPTGAPLKLRLGVGLLNWEVRLLYGIKIHDVLSGMWVVRRTVVDRLGLNMGDWNLSPEIKIKAFRDPGINASELAIVQHDRHGTSHQAYFKTGTSHALWILRHRFGSDPGTVPDRPTASAPSAAAR